VTGAIAAAGNVPAGRLQQLTEHLLRAAGCDPAEAKVVAEHLVGADLSGHDSHGIGLLATYVANVQRGLLVPNAELRTVRDDGAFLSLDGARGFGQRLALEAVARAIERVHETGVVVLTLANSHHRPHRPLCGRMCRGRPVLVLPRQRCRPAAAGGAAWRHRRAPVHQPADARSAAWGRTATGDSELLAGGLGSGHTTQPAHPRSGAITNNLFGIVWDPVRMTGSDGIGTAQREMQALVSHVKGSPPSDPARPVQVAGDPERAALVRRGREGIPLDPTTRGELLDAGEALGLARASLVALLEGDSGV